MWFRRRQETYNEQMLREAGLDRPEPEPVPDAADPPPLDPLEDRYPAQSHNGAFRAAARPQQFDVYATCRAPELAGDAVEFVTLIGGDIIVEEEQGEAALSPLADAVEEQLEPPYRASGRRQEGALWAVGARQIEVRRLEREGDEFEELDGDTMIRGTRLDGDLWEIDEVGRI